MVTATLSRGSTSVEIPLIASGSTPLVSRDTGRPNLELQPNGELDPRHSDQFSGLETYTLLGRFHGANAYADAVSLADLIKSNANGTPLRLDIGMPEYDSNMKVCPAAGQEEAVSFNYPAGKTNTVEIDVGLSRIAETFGGTPQPASTPTATGTGPVTISNGRSTIQLVQDIQVSRGVGRPQSQIKKNTNKQYPNHYEKTKTAYDAFELSLQFNSNTVDKINTLADMFTRKLRRDSLTLDFQGQYGLGAFNVVPSGSGALRHVRQSGKKDTMIVPTIKLRRVQ